MSNLEELYCCIDDFCQKFMPLWHQLLIENELRKRHREASLSLSSISEVMMILILFHMRHYRDFKTFYNKHVKQYLTDIPPELISYTRMLTLEKRALIPFLTIKRVSIFILTVQVESCLPRSIPISAVLFMMMASSKRKTHCQFTAIGWEKSSHYTS
ncbi:transposase [Xenorhabdus ishibashii]|uniref:Transposase n=1 Tax=Xenorhabdus ishibashii TaxID=1034471 RepID=A0A2D0KHY2_9GAMM|nr:hypothetical protein [Xenorhabdus ishibashii]PHM63002.1 transposase [Xenorhabdus ishibashii]